MNDTDFIAATHASDNVITTQAPLAFTRKDFWNMVCQYNASVIIMLNDLNEDDEDFESCPAYWPKAETKNLEFGSLMISLESETVEWGNVTKRELNLITDESLQDVKHVTQYHVTDWLEHETPPNTQDLLELLKTLSELMVEQPDSMFVVVCSDGLGRSGCLCACLLCLRVFQERRKVNVCDVLSELRAHHPGYVETEAQFRFIFQLLQAYIRDTDD